MLKSYNLKIKLKKTRYKPPPKPNKTKKHVASDVFYTNPETAISIIDYFKPAGSILDPCAGKDAFYGNFKNKEKYRCEISEGTDFLQWNKRIDWIITNPPYSIYDAFLLKALEVADNIVFLVPISKAFKSDKIERAVMQFGGLKEIIYMGSGRKHKFPFGFSLGCIYYQRNYKGKCKITHFI